jgi:hypothetical protein
MLNKPGPQDFFDLKKMPDHSKKDTVVALERRHFPRYSITASAEATDVKSQTRIKARISDLGRWGCYVDTLSPFVVDTVVKIGIEKDAKAQDSSQEQNRGSNA